MKYLISVLLSATIASTAFAAPPPYNLSDVKQQLIEYHQSGEYTKDISHVTKQAEDYLDKRLAENAKSEHPEKLAMVLDIDETSLSNYNYLKDAQFGDIFGVMEQAQKRDDESAIAPTLNLYRFAKNHGVAVFFITGRPERLRKITEKDLNSAGYYKWNGLFMRPNGHEMNSAVPYKTATRKKIADMGYTIVVNMGDQKSDLSGGYAEQDYKLPNPYYYIP